MTLVVKICNKDDRVLFTGEVEDDQVSVIWRPNGPSSCTIRGVIWDALHRLTLRESRT